MDEEREDLSWNEMKQIQTQKAEYEQRREEKFKHDCKARLSKIMQKKVITTTIGALSSAEQHFGHLWADDTPEGRAMYEAYQRFRSEVLDKGNAQARNIDVELNQYDIKWLRYNMQLPFVPKSGSKTLLPRKEGQDD